MSAVSEPTFLEPDNLKGLVFLPYGSGHLNPTLQLIKELVETTQHHLVVFNLPKNKERVEATGATFRRFPNGDDFSVENYCPPDTPFFLQLLYSSEVLVPFVAKMVNEEKPDYILHDYHFFWVRYVAELLNIPAVCVSPSMLGYLPVYDLLLRDERSEEIAQRLQKLYGGEVDLNTVMTNYEDCTLVFCSRYLQTNEEKYPVEAGFNFIGPQIALRHGGIDLNNPVCTRVEDFLSQPSSVNGPPKRIVYMSMGSLYRPTEKFLSPFIEGIRQIEGVLFVLNIGKGLEMEDVREKWNYSNVVLVKWAPQLYLLEKASVFVTHAGMNSLVESCCFGCPMLLIPKFADQPTNAARVEDLGAGVILSRDEYSQSENIRNSTETLLTSAHYQENTHKIALSLLHYSLSPSQIHSLPPSPLPSSSQLGKGGEEGARVVEKYVRNRMREERKKGLVGGGIRGFLGGHVILAGTPLVNRMSSVPEVPSKEHKKEHPSCC